MPTEATCPRDRHPLTQVGKHWICPEHGQISPGGPPLHPFSFIIPTSCTGLHPFSIFLSYGHEAHEELVRQIKTDLDARGHDVWFDKNDIKAGDDWWRAITDEIKESMYRMR